ncbi:hypothetical protein [Burkholderia gladioli]|uniref:hypothetical protein n=1 Tax=Burkholderia gladioli TaxID=28095 RepID=UPI001E49A625|nr:hypothetical protein [Burkholderia gladioli]
MVIEVDTQVVNTVPTAASRGTVIEDGIDTVKVCAVLEQLAVAQAACDDSARTSRAAQRAASRHAAEAPWR